jgi:hypothetical protein
MIYEVRTYDLKPASVPEVEKRFGEAYEHRRKYSELAAFWHTEIGPLNQIIHVWPYKDLAERTRVREAAAKDPNWPPKIKDFIVAQHSEIVNPIPFAPLIKPGKMGPFFEMRTYTLPPGGLALAMDNWERALPGRMQLRPICTIWTSELGPLNKWVHIWPYESLDQRMATRKQARDSGDWPPATFAKKEGREGIVYVAQETKILVPSAFSPLQ